jgi:hypothetical protein
MESCYARADGVKMQKQAAGAVCVVGCRLLIVAAIGALLAGCDRCGDFASPFKVEACRDTAPPRP